MDDLTSKITELLGDPNAMEQIKSLAGLFGSAKEEPKVSQQQPQPQQSQQPQQESNLFDDFALNADTIQMVMKFLPLLNGIKEEDDNTRLLVALRPFLGEERQKKLDEAAKMLGLLKMLPMLKSLGGIF